MADERKRVEYQAAQEMLRHYDSLNWQIGAVLIAATTILTGFGLQKDVIELIQVKDRLSVVIVLAIPGFSWSVLGAWYLWFRRHRELYNFRNETLQRLELELGMYHYLRVVETEFRKYEANLRRELTEAGYDQRMETLLKARANAYGEFKPFYPMASLSDPSGFTLRSGYGLAYRRSSWFCSEPYS